MSKGIMNRRDKMIWDNSALPTIDNVTGQINELAESVAEDIQDAYEELDDKIDQAITDCTYTAGDGINIDENNKVGVNIGEGLYLDDNNKISIKKDLDPFNNGLFTKSYTGTNISGTATINLTGLVDTPVAIYLVYGYGKDASDNIYPFNSSNIDVVFTPTTCVLTIADGITLTEYAFEIKYTINQAYVTYYKDDQLSARWSGSSSGWFTETIVSDVCYVGGYSSNWNYDGSTRAVFISLTQGTTMVTGRDTLVANTAYTYNGHTIYYVDYASSGGWPIEQRSLYNTITGGKYAKFANATTALQGFITQYFS